MKPPENITNKKKKRKKKLLHGIGHHHLDKAANYRMEFLFVPNTHSMNGYVK